jgi:hypothetical protein
MRLCNSSVEPTHHCSIVNQAAVLAHNFSEIHLLRSIVREYAPKARALRQPDPGGGAGGGGAFCPSGGRPTYLPVSVMITLIM